MMYPWVQGGKVRCLMAEERVASCLAVASLSDDSCWKDWRDAGREMVD